MCPIPLLHSTMAFPMAWMQHARRAVFLEDREIATTGTPLTTPLAGISAFFETRMNRKIPGTLTRSTDPPPLPHTHPPLCHQLKPRSSLEPVPPSSQTECPHTNLPPSMPPATRHIPLVTGYSILASQGDKTYRLLCRDTFHQAVPCNTSRTPVGDHSPCRCSPGSASRCAR